MPDMSALTPEQNEAIRDIGWALDEYKQAIERRVAATEAEAKARYTINDITYKIAGVQ